MRAGTLAAGLLAALLLSACAGTAQRPGTPPAPAPASAPAPEPPARVRQADPSPPKPASAPSPEPAATPEPAGTLDALVQGFSVPGCPDDRVVARWRRGYLRSPQRFTDNLQRVLPLLDYVARQTRARGLPAEFALLPIVESWYRPDARNGGTAGMWQLAAGTARAHGLRVDAGADDRYLPAAATHAALDLLEALMQRFGDWRLATMAYNAGEYRLARALAAGDDAGAEPSPARHRPGGLSMTTYEHLAKVMALRCIVLDPAAHGVQLPGGWPQPLVEVRSVAGAAALERALRAQGLDPAAFWRLNPERSDQRGRTRPRLLLVPGDAGALASLDAPARDGDATAAAERHRVARGENLWLIARRYGLRVRDLLEWNGLDAEAPLMPGQWLRLEP